MHKKTLTTLFSEHLYKIPDYQRGYAWIEKQWNDFAQDIDALAEDDVRSHYTGTVVVYSGREAKVVNYGTRRLKVVDVVDGQQRLTTSCLYLSLIIRALIKNNELAYERDIPDFLYADEICKLELNNDTSNIFYDLLKTGRSNTPPRSPHEKRLVAACNHFQSHLDNQLKIRGSEGTAYLKELYIAVTQKLNFTFYTIEDECEIGMTFELMNSRGKGLSVLELLKNYLMHWVSRNETVEQEREALTRMLNKSWKDTYTNLGTCSGNEDQCLRIAWTLYCSHTPKNWIGYDGFKDDNYIPLRNFTAKRDKAVTKAFISRLANGLSEISSHYACITSPTSENTMSSDELLWLSKIHHTGNIANFLPLMVAARKYRAEGTVTEEEYIELLKTLECYAYRVFLHEGRRSNAGKSSFNRWGHEIFHTSSKIGDVVAAIHSLSRHYSSEKSFTDGNATPENWYAYRALLKYTLYEYELHLLESEGKGSKARLAWEDLKDSTIEHILPQTPDEHSHWLQTWSPDDFATHLHDIGNLVLTHNNSNYLNFDFSRKKGVPGQGPSYSDSDIRQERKISSYADWTPLECMERRTELANWINARWKTKFFQDVPPLDVTQETDEADEDGIELANEEAILMD